MAASRTDRRLTVPEERPDGTTTSWLVYAAGLVVLSVLWAVASPLFSVPDEPAHYVKAAAVARGQLSGRTVQTDLGVDLLAVDVPEKLKASYAFPGCYMFRNDVTADCAPEEFVGASTDIEVATQAGSYPPLFYALTGGPTVLSTGPDGVYAARGLAAVASGLLVASAAWALSSLLGRRLAMAGGLFVGTPMVLYLGASINPNGFENAAAIATWAFALVALRRGAAGVAVPRWMCAGLVVAGAALALTRWLSPLYLVGIIGLVGLSLPLGQLRVLVRDRRLQITAGLLGVAFVVAGVTIALTPNRTLIPGAPIAPGNSAVQTLVGATQSYIDGFVGIFGWLDTPPPAYIQYVWFGLVAALAGVVLLLGRGPVLRATLLTAAATFVFPIVSQLPSVDDVGIPWQGRYTLPLAVGVPILLAGTVDLEAMRSRLDRLALVVVWLCGVGHLIAFYWALRRYATGYFGALDIFTAPDWRTPMGNGWAVLSFAAVVVALGVLTSQRSPEDRGAAPLPADVERRRPDPVPV